MKIAKPNLSIQRYIWSNVRTCKKKLFYYKQQRQRRCFLNYIKQFIPNVLFLYPMEISEKHDISDIFRG